MLHIDFNIATIRHIDHFKGRIDHRAARATCNSCHLHLREIVLDHFAEVELQSICQFVNILVLKARYTIFGVVEFAIVPNNLDIIEDCLDSLVLFILEPLSYSPQIHRVFNDLRIIIEFHCCIGCLLYLASRLAPENLANPGDCPNASIL